jgi:hypothetical protein
LCPGGDDRGETGEVDSEVDDQGLYPESDERLQLRGAGPQASAQPIIGYELRAGLGLLSPG